VRLTERLRHLDDKVFFRPHRESTLGRDLLGNLVIAIVFATIGVAVILAGRRPEGWGVIAVASGGLVIRSVGDLAKRR
jgi:hypothetical protein